MSMYNKIADSFAAQGMSAALDTLPLSAFMPEDEVESHVVLTDMQVDPEVGVQVLLTLALISSTNLLVIDVLPVSESGKVRCNVRSTPLHSILEVRTTFVSDATTNLAQMIVQVVTAETAQIAMDPTICGSPLLEGGHVEWDDLTAYEQEQVTVCTDVRGYVGDITHNFIEFVADATLGSEEETRDLLSFAATLSRLSASCKS